jgi:CBS domain-containing protein/Flp pilus assembly pilin Flp
MSLFGSQPYLGTSDRDFVATESVANGVFMAPSNRTQPLFKDLARGCAASAAVEYAVCLGLIVGTILAAGFLLGTPLQNAFSNSAAGLQSLAGAPSSQGVESDSNGAALTPTNIAPPSGRTPGFWLPIVTVGIVPFLAALWLIRRRASQPAPADVPAPMLMPKELQAKFVEKRQTILKYLSAETRQIVNGYMAARNIMSKTPLTRSPQDDVVDLRKLMKEKDLRHLVVCSATGALAGIISDRDILGRSGSRAADVMTANPLTVSPDTPVNTVITMFLTRRINCVPVVDHDRVCGIITTSDLLMSLQCILRLIEQLALPLEKQPLEPPPSDDEATADFVGSR